MLTLRGLVALVLTGTALAGLSPAGAAAIQQTEVVSLDKNGLPAMRDSSRPQISEDGRWVVFASADPDLIGSDTNDAFDIFVRDRFTGENRRISIRSNGNQGNGDSTRPSISADGRFIVFQSDASNLVANDDNDLTDVFIHDRDNNADGILDNSFLTFKLSNNTGGGSANGRSLRPRISATGRAVVFESLATNLTDDIVASTPDVFLVDRDPNANGSFGDDTDVTVLISLSETGTNGDASESAPDVDVDGRFVVFHSPSTNLTSDDTNGAFYDVYLRDRDPDGNGDYYDDNATTTLITRNSAGEVADRGGQFPRIAGDGRWIVFESNATNLGSAVPPGAPPLLQVWARDLLAGQTVLLSRTTSGLPGDDHSQSAVVGLDARFVGFESRAKNLDPGGVASWDVFLLDRDVDEDGVLDEAGATSLTRRSVSDAGAAGDSESRQPSISSDGRHTAFVSMASNLVPGGAPGGIATAYLNGAPPDIPPPTGFLDLGEGVTGFAGIPVNSGSGELLGNDAVSIRVDNARPGSLSFLIIGFGRLDLPFAGGVMVPTVDIICVITVAADKSAVLPGIWPSSLPSGYELYFQWWTVDPSAIHGLSASNGLMSRSP